MHHLVRQHEDVVNERSRNFAAKWLWKIASVKNCYSIPRLVSALYATVTWTWGYLMTNSSCPCYCAEWREIFWCRILKRMGGSESERKQWEQPQGRVPAYISVTDDCRTYTLKLCFLLWNFQDNDGKLKILIKVKLYLYRPTQAPALHDVEAPWIPIKSAYEGWTHY
jgi:hypothetical protein